MNQDDSIQKILSRVNNMKYRLVFDSLLVGILTGILIVIYRVLAKFFGDMVKGFYSTATTFPLFIVAVFVVLIIFSFIVAYFVKEEPMISGSGIPQVEGILKRKLSYSWWKVLIYKFVGGVICLASGMSVGREGPSVQMGSCVGAGMSKTSKKQDSEKKYLVTAGASAGLAAAFGAPLAGTMFALEEAHKNFSPMILISSMIAAISADVVSKQVLGISPSLQFDRLNVMPLKYYWALIVLGIIIGISGKIFNTGILFTKRSFSNSKLDIKYKMIIPFVLTGIIGLTIPSLLGGGHEIIMDLKVEKLTIFILLVYIVIKFLFTFICFGSGVPGGIFFPLLALGALVGNLVGVISVKDFGVPEIYLMNFVVLAMAGHFAAIVKAPITGIILIFEMTGSFEQLLPLSVVVFIAMVTSDLLKADPIYESLLEDIVEKNPDSYKPQREKKTLTEFSVNVGCECANKFVKEIKWPDNVLLVAIYRGNHEIIPRGNTLIMEGDFITVMSDINDSPDVIEYMDKITAPEEIE